MVSRKRSFSCAGRIWGMGRPTQFSLSWLLTETAFIAIACAGLRLVIASDIIDALNQGMGFMMFFVAGFGAIGGLFQKSATGIAVGSLIGFLSGTAFLLLFPMPIH